MTCPLLWRARSPRFAASSRGTWRSKSRPFTTSRCSPRKARPQLGASPTPQCWRRWLGLCWRTNVAASSTSATANPRADGSSTRTELLRCTVAGTCTGTATCDETAGRSESIASRGYTDSPSAQLPRHFAQLEPLDGDRTLLRSSTSNLDWFAWRIGDLPFRLCIRTPGELRDALRQNAAALLEMAATPREGPTHSTL